MADGRSRVTVLVNLEGDGIGQQLIPLVVRRQVRAEVPDDHARSNALSGTTASDVAASRDALRQRTAATDRAEGYARVRSAAGRLARICCVAAATLARI